MRSRQGVSGITVPVLVKVFAEMLIILSILLMFPTFFIQFLAICYSLVPEL